MTHSIAVKSNWNLKIDMWKNRDHKLPQFMNLASLVSSRFMGQTLRILFLADNRHPANVVMEHINAFPRWSRHSYTIVNPIHDLAPTSEWMKQFDAVVIHYSIYVLGEYFLPKDWAQIVHEFNGMKAQLIQDECRHIDAMKRRIDDLGMHFVISILDEQSIEPVYGGTLLENVAFYSSLPGYIDDSHLAFNPPPIKGRPFDIVYRGRTLPAYLGRHALLKKKIGDQVLAVAETYGLKVDINSTEESRIYGQAWPQFLMSSRATLGVEGGMSIFDFSGELEQRWCAYREAHPEASEEQAWKDIFQFYEANIVYKTITPKFFEAIAAKTALVLYPGKYSGILQEGVHYIRLDPDGSNLNEVIETLKDDEYLQTMVDRAYEEVMFRENLSVQFFIEQFDLALESNWSRAPKTLTIRKWLLWLGNSIKSV